MKNAIKTVEGLLKDKDRQSRKVKSVGKKPLTNRYWLELEHSDDLSLDIMYRYLQLIGILRWAVELKHRGIFTEVAVIS